MWSIKELKGMSVSTFVFHLVLWISLSFVLGGRFGGLTF